MNEIYQVLVEDKKIINALSNSGKYLVSDNVIVKTSRGEQYGRVNAINNKIDIEMNDIYIIRKANKKDYNNYLKNLRLSEDMLRFAKQEALNPEFLQDEVNILNLYEAYNKYDYKAFFAKVDFLKEYLQFGSAKNLAKILSEI